MNSKQTLQIMKVAESRLFSFTVDSLPEGLHQFTLNAQAESGAFSDVTPVLRVVVDFVPPVVSHLRGANGDTSVSLEWTALPEPDIVGYWIYRDGLTKPLHQHRIIAEAFPTFTDFGLTNGRSYTYRALAEDAAGQKGPLSDSTTVTPLAGTKWTIVP